MKILYTKEFEKRFKDLPLLIKKKAIKQEDVFKINPWYPSLNLEKLEPKNREYWSIRIDINYRIILKFLNNNEVIFMYCGHHNSIYKF